MKSLLYGVYALTPDEPDTRRLMQQVAAALAGGVRILQYRNKIAGPALQLAQAQALRELTASAGAMLIINDDPELALETGADGVHLGAEDGAVGAARVLLGPERLIGVSCYNRAPLARQAAAEGADYVAFGAFYPSAIKPGAVRAEPQVLRQARAELALPIVAIGGITAQNGGVLLEAGADALAVITALWQAPDIERAARELTTLFGGTES